MENPSHTHTHTHMLDFDLPGPYSNILGCVYAVVSLPFHRTAYQRSQWGKSFASNAIDGNVWTSSCTLTEFDEPWWAVDLQGFYKIAIVEVVNDNNDNYGRSIC